MKRFLVSYLIPAAVIADWMKTDPEKRKGAEEKMRAEWNEWTARHAAMLKETAVGGKTRKVTSSGTADTNNGVMMFAFIEAESHEDATKAFENHPHLQIPQASIEIMEVKPMMGM